MDHDSAYKAAVASAVWAKSQVRLNAKPEEVEVAVVSAFICVVLFGLVGSWEDHQSGEYTRVNYGADPVVPSQNDVDEISELATDDAINRCLTVMVATKVNFLSNHHTGQGVTSPYVSKVLEAKYPKAKENMRALADCAYIVGHWMSTHRGLQLGGVWPGNLFRPWFVNYATDDETGISSVFKEDQSVTLDSSMQSGTSKHTTAYTVMRKYGSTAIFSVLSLAQQEMLDTLFKEVATVVKHRHRVSEVNGERRDADKMIDPTDWATL